MSRFNLTKPCDSCPFLKGTIMRLQPDRCREIAAADFFICHKTADYDGEEEYDADGSRPLRDGDQACVGHMILRHKEDLIGIRRIPQMMQIAERIGILNTEKVIVKNLGLVFDTVDEMADHSKPE